MYHQWIHLIEYDLKIVKEPNKFVINKNNIFTGKKCERNF